MNEKDKPAVFLRLWQSPGYLLFVHFFFSAICGFLVFARNFHGFKNSIESGLSIWSVSFFAALILIVALVLLWSGVHFLMKPDQAGIAAAYIFKDVRNREALLRIAGIGFLLSWLGFFFPSYRTPEQFSGYYLQLRPLLIWGALHFGSIVAIIHFESDRCRIGPAAASNKILIRAVLFVFLILLLVSGFMFYSGYGISIQEDYWYGTGVPVLWVQIFLSVFIGVFLAWALKHVPFVRSGSKFDVIVFIVLWVLTAYLWGKEPLKPSYFMPDTGVNQIYPYSDSATFDIGSQYAVIGQGLFNGQYFDRSLYPALLVYLHGLSGQDTESLMVLQAVLFAVFPSILFLVGCELHGRVLGISLGFLMMLRGINSIFGASLIDMAGPKMMLTDFPTMIGISLIILFIIRWLNHPGRISSVIWAGSFIGLTLLLRTHVILLLPFIISYMIIHFRNKKLIWIYGSTLLVLGMITSTLPLDLQNQKKGVPFFYMYYSRIQQVLKYRYEISNSSNISNEQHLSIMVERGRLAFHKAEQRLDCSSKICSVGNHFFHNLAASVLYLPASFVPDDFRHTVKEVAPYWQKDWTGRNMSSGNYLLVIINLFVISLGVGIIWRKSRWIGLFPLMIYFVYQLSNSLAFTSGGRYVTPVDWIICIFYLMGALRISVWLMDLTGFDFAPNDDEGEMREAAPLDLSLSPMRAIGIFLAIFMIGSLIPFADVLFPERYHQGGDGEVLTTLNNSGMLEEANLSASEIAEFLTLPDARLISGRLLYPRFYPSGKGEDGLDYPYTALDYRRLVFTMIGPFGAYPIGVILPVENSKPGLHASDVMVLGCVNGNFLDAVALFVLSEPKRTIVRSTESLLLQCPLPNQ